MSTVQPGVCVGISLDDDRYEIGDVAYVGPLLLFLLLFSHSHSDSYTCYTSGLCRLGAKPSSVRKVKEKKRK